MQLVFLFILHSVVVITHAQRPFFAGSRPEGGLNQKDKYNHPELAYGLTTSTVASPEIGNRFGNSNNANQNKETVLIHRPPVANGLSIVYPEEKYEPIPIHQAASDTNFDNDLSNRFGNSDTNIGVIIPTNNKSVKNVPFDARGDDKFVKQLSQLPLDQQPFWFINYQAIEAQRNRSVSNSQSS